MEIIDDLESWLEKCESPFYFLSSHAPRLYTEVSYTADTCLIFGSETKGLNPRFKERWPDKFIKIPMKPEARCLNLATSVGIALYEIVRQKGLT
jgi:tRNA (cytidine/uridine-2'-O-)-methyltransferase